MTRFWNDGSLLCVNVTSPLLPLALWPPRSESVPIPPFGETIGVETVVPSNMKLLMWRTVLSVFPGGPGGPGGPVWFHWSACSLGRHVPLVLTRSNPEPLFAQALI